MFTLHTVCGTVELLEMPMNTPLYIWMITSELPPEIAGGLGVHVAVLSRHLAARGVTIRFVLLPYYAAEGGNSYEWEGHTVYPLPFPRPGYTEEGGITVQAELRDTLQRLREKVAEDAQAGRVVIHAHEWFGALCGEHLAGQNYPLVTTFHLFSGMNSRGECSIPGTEEGRLVFEAEQHAGRISNRIIHISKAMQQTAAAYGFDTAREEVIHNCMDPELAACIEDVERSTARRQWCNETDFLVLAAGRFVEQKGFHFMLEALMPALKLVPALRLILAGQGDLYDKLTLLANQYRGAVRIVPFQDRAGWASLIKAADAALVPSLYEPFGQIALDYMSAGLPVLASDAGGLAEILRHRENGLLIPLRHGRWPGYAEKRWFPDINQYAAGIAELFHNAAFRKTIGQSAALDAAERFSADTQADAVLAVYEACVRG